MRKRLLLVLLVLAIITLVVGCGNKEKAGSGSILEEKVLRVATPGQHFPWNYYESGELVGIDIATLDEACRRIGYDLEYEIIAFEGIYGAIDAGLVDSGA